MNRSTLTLVIEVEDLTVSEKRQQAVVELVNLAEGMGYKLNDFRDENELLRKISDQENLLQTDLIYKKFREMPATAVNYAQSRLDMFGLIASQIYSELNLLDKIYG